MQGLYFSVSSRRLCLQVSGHIGLVHQDVVPADGKTEYIESLAESVWPCLLAGAWSLVSENIPRNVGWPALSHNWRLAELQEELTSLSLKPMALS